MELGLAASMQRQVRFASARGARKKRPGRAALRAGRARLKGKALRGSERHAKNGRSPDLSVNDGGLHATTIHSLFGAAD